MVSRAGGPHHWWAVRPGLGGRGLPTGRARHPPRPPPAPAAANASTTEGDRRADAARGTDRARAGKGVTDVVISIGAGQPVVALPEGDRYLGFVFARGGTPDE